MDIIFDIDGTIANCEHRQHYLRIKPKNWRAFEAGILNDIPITNNVAMYHILKDAGNRIVFATGRMEHERKNTLIWLHEHCRIIPERLYMREDRDNRDDGIVKSEMLDQMRLDGYDPMIVFDDRDRVVKMWRERGLTCYQVNYGDF